MNALRRCDTIKTVRRVLRYEGGAALPHAGRLVTPASASALGEKRVKGFEPSTFSLGS